MSETLPITACVITLNEEENIERCLESVRWADEILVVDSGSTDDTVELAESMGARVLHNDWPGMGEQKQYATDRAKHDWIFSLDADEKVSDDLAGSIRDLFSGGKPEPETSYQVNRLAEFMGRWIYHGCWHPDWIIRLFNRNSTSWGGENPHSHVVPTENVAALDGFLYHWPYDGLSDQVDHINSYSSTAARQKSDKGETGGVARGLLHAFGRLVKDFLIKFSWLDGKEGLIITFASTYEKFLKYVKLMEVNQNLESEQAPPPGENKS